MKITIAKILPQDDELLCDLYYRMKEHLEYYTNKHQDTSIDISQEDGYVLIKSLKLEDNVN